MIDVILAVPELPNEAELVAHAPAMGVRILRRCVDAIDLLAAAASDPHVPVIVSAALPRVPADLIERLGAGRAVIGLAHGDHAAELLQRLGVPVQRTGASVADTWALLLTILDGEPAAGVWTTGVWDPDDVPDHAERGSTPGRVIAVWGPQGAPGRTTVAVGVAEAIARGGRSCCLVDADTYGPSVAMALGIVEEASGLVVAGRHADNATLTPATLAGLCHRMSGRWQVLGGIGRPERWPDVRTGSLDRLWEVARDAFEVTVVDVGFCLEADEGPWSSRRNAATLSALAAADRVLAVADASALGAARLAAAWPALVAASPLAERLVVRNRAARRDHGWDAAVTAHRVVEPILPVPRDDRAAAVCWAGGRSPAEAARRSGLRRALGAVAERAVSP